MARQRHLKNAPIIEALIDFRVNLPSEFDVEQFTSVAEDFSRRYPNKEPIRLSEFAFGLEQGKPVIKAPVDKGIRGYIFKSADGKNVAQFRVDGFTFSRLNPYTDWQTVFAEASRIWNIYYLISSPDLITRITTRYINRLDIPISLKNFNEYLTAPPKVPKSLPQQVSQFLTRIEIHEDSITANIVQALDKSLKPDSVGVILDIDVFKVNEKGFNKESVLSEFIQLRELKNRIFFKSITEKTARLYK